MNSYEKRIDQLCEAREFWEIRLEQLAGCGWLERAAEARLAELDQEFYALVNEKAPEATETFSQKQYSLLPVS